MKTEFKAKFLQHVAQKRKEEGFTLIELLVVIIIIGILSAIALPSFLNQANKAKQSEAKQYIASLNKGQQAFYVENNAFTGVASDLGLGIKTATGNYTYSLNVADAGSTNAKAYAWTSSSTGALNGYGGAVFLVPSGAAQTSESIICEQTTIAAAYAFAQTTCTANNWKDL